MKRLEVYHPEDNTWRLMFEVKEGQKASKKGNIITLSWALENGDKAVTIYDLSFFAAYTIV